VTLTPDPPTPPRTRPVLSTPRVALPPPTSKVRTGSAAATPNFRRDGLLCHHHRRTYERGHAGRRQIEMCERLSLVNGVPCQSLQRARAPAPPGEPSGRARRATRPGAGCAPPSCRQPAGRCGGRSSLGWPHRSRRPRCGARSPRARPRSSPVGAVAPAAPRPPPRTGLPAQGARRRWRSKRPVRPGSAGW
jgi:hypothetical protein